MTAEFGPDRPNPFAGGTLYAMIGAIVVVFALTLLLGACNQEPATNQSPAASHAPPPTTALMKRSAVAGSTPAGMPEIGDGAGAISVGTSAKAEDTRETAPPATPSASRRVIVRT